VAIVEASPRVDWHRRGDGLLCSNGCEHELHGRKSARKSEPAYRRYTVPEDDSKPSREPMSPAEKAARATLGDALLNPALLGANADLMAKISGFSKLGSATKLSSAVSQLGAAMAPKSVADGFGSMSSKVAMDQLREHITQGSQQGIPMPVPPWNPVMDTNRHLEAMREQAERVEAERDEREQRQVDILEKVLAALESSEAERAKSNKTKTRWKVAAYTGTVATAIAVSPYAAGVARWFGHWF
jgi:hypothetical protein